MIGPVGRPVGVEVKVLDELGASLPAGAVGELAIRGKSVITAYEGTEGANAEHFTDGHLRTGDQVTVKFDVTAAR